MSLSNSTLPTRRGGFRRYETWNFRNFLAKKPASSQRTMSSSALFFSSATPVSGLPVARPASATPQICLKSTRTTPPSSFPAFRAFRPSRSPPPRARARSRTRPPWTDPKPKPTPPKSIGSSMTMSPKSFTAWNPTRRLWSPTSTYLICISGGARHHRAVAPATPGKARRGSVV